MNTDNIRRLTDKIKTIGFWERLFGWKSVRILLFDAVTELEQLITTNTFLKEQSSRSDNEKMLLQAELDSTNRSLTVLSKDKELLTTKLYEAELQLQQLKQDNLKLQSNETLRIQEHSKAMATLHTIQQDIQTTRQKETDEQHRAALDRVEKLKATWSDHEEMVRQSIKTICNKHTIHYVSNVPFKGNPDNTIEISGEYIVFDAKSPAGDDLANFPKYIKKQVEEAKKYASQENVKKWVFLVVPSNTLSTLDSFVYHVADYDVFIISTDGLEPVILSLKKIEDYDFAKQLSPEDRENICRVLGKFAHLAKRRIQIDSFFIKQFMELAYKAENDLPKEILDKVIEFEIADKINPPTERRTKQINLKELEHDSQRLQQETTAKGIAMVEEVITNTLNELPLYTTKAEDG